MDIKEIIATVNQDDIERVEKQLSCAQYALGSFDMPDLEG